MHLKLQRDVLSTDLMKLRNLPWKPLWNREARIPLPRKRPPRMNPLSVLLMPGMLVRLGQTCGQDTQTDHLNLDTAEGAS